MAPIAASARGPAPAPSIAYAPPAPVPLPAHFVPPAVVAQPVARIAETQCTNCGSANPASMRFCRTCGQTLAADAPVPQPAQSSPVVCPKCRAALDRDASFCGLCGYGLGAAQPLPLARPVNLAPAPSAQAAARAPQGNYERPELLTDHFGQEAVQGNARLVTILKDGSEGAAYRLQTGTTDVGRSEGNILLPDDPYLSPRHVRIQFRSGRYYVRDLSSVNGVFYRLRDPVTLQHGDLVLVGQQVMRLEILADAELSLGPVMHQGAMLFGTPELPRLGRLVQLTTEGIPRDVYHLHRDETVVGREQGDIVFTDDPFLSRRHAAFRLDRAQRRVSVRDLGSSNGTLVQYRGEREITTGDFFRIGHHLFRFDAGHGGNAQAAAGGASGR